MLGNIPLIILGIIVFVVIILVLMSIKVLMPFLVGPSDVHESAPRRKKVAPKPKPQKKIRQKTPKPTPAPVITQVPKPKPAPTKPIPTTPLPITPIPTTPIPTTPISTQSTPISTDNRATINQLKFKINSVNNMIENLEKEYREGSVEQQVFFEKRKFFGEKLASLRAQLQSLN